MSIQALREQLSQTNREAKALLADKGSQTWTAEDKAKFDGLMDTAERLQAQIEAHQRVLDDDAQSNFQDAQRTDRSAASPEVKAAREGFEIFLRKSAREMSQEEALKVRNTMSTTTGSEGGFTVQTLVAKEWIELLKSYAFMRREASQITTENGADLSYPTSDGTSEVGELLAQNAPANSADASFGTRALNCYKFGSKIITVPIELLQDTSIDILALIYGRMRDRIGRAQNVYFTTGTGSSQPVGLTAAASVGKVGTTGQTTTIIYDDLVDMVDSLDAAYLDNPVSDPSLANPEPCWMFGQTLRKTLRKLKDSSGRPLWTPSYDQGIRGATPDTLMGYPVCINNDMPAPAANAKSLAFGNLKKYLIRDAMQVSMFRFDDSAYMSKGQVGFLAWSRAGGNLMDLNSVKLYQHSAT